MKKLIRTATVSISLNVLLKGQLQYLNSFYKVIAVSNADNHLLEVANRENIKTIEVEFERKISLFKDLLSLYKLYKVLKSEKPFIIHSITPKAGLLSMIAGFLASVPIRIHTFTGLIFPTKTGLTKHILILMDKILCQFATHIYPEGNGVKKDLIKFKITKKPLKIIANGNINGIDCDYFNASNFSSIANNNLRNQLKIQQTDFVFIFIGRMVADKGMNELINSFVEISKLNNNTKLILVGPNEQHLNPLKNNTIHEINTNKNIISVGWQDDVRPFLAIAKALVFPSYREGFPNVVLQAGAMNLPCIVSNISGCNEIITSDFNGLIIEPRSENEVLNAMNLFINDVNFVRKLAANARQNIIDNFEQSLVWQAILNEYHNLESNYK